MSTPNDIKDRLEYLRGELRAERMSYGELVELQDLASHIEDGDVELLEAAGVPEHEATQPQPPQGERNRDLSRFSHERTIELLLQQRDALQAQRDDLLAALREAAEWLSRSTRIDDQEQAQDACAAIARATSKQAQ